MRENLRRLNKQKPPCSMVGLMGKKPGFLTLSINLDIKLAQLQCPGSPSAPISLWHTEPVPAAQIQIQRGSAVGHQLQEHPRFSTAGKPVLHTVPTRELLALLLYPQPQGDIKNMEGAGQQGH